jgi:hypothetical protein
VTPAQARRIARRAGDVLPQTILVEAVPQASAVLLVVRRPEFASLLLDPIEARLLARRLLTASEDAERGDGG